MKHLKNTLCLLLALCFYTNAQTPKAINSTDENKDWIQIETENKELSLSIPDNYTFFIDEEGYDTIKGRYSREKISFRNLRSLTAYENGISMWIESYDVKNGEEAFRYFGANASSDIASYKTYKVGKYFLQVKSAQSESSTINYYYFYSDKRVYFMGFGIRNSDPPGLQKFLKSITFMREKLFAEGSQEVEEINGSNEKLIYEKIDVTPISISYNEPDINKKPKKSVKSNDAKIDNSDDPKADIPTTKDKNEIGIAILTKPKPGYTDLARRKNIKGYIRLKVYFGSNGLIKSIEVVKSLENGLTQKTVDATRQIRFLPPSKNGIPYTVVKTVQFDFDIY